MRISVEAWCEIHPWQNGREKGMVECKKGVASSQEGGCDYCLYEADETACETFLEENQRPTKQKKTKDLDPVIRGPTGNQWRLQDGGGLDQWQGKTKVGGKCGGRSKTCFEAGGAKASEQEHQSSKEGVPLGCAQIS